MATKLDVPDVAFDIRVLTFRTDCYLWHYLGPIPVQTRHGSSDSVPLHSGQNTRFFPRTFLYGPSVRASRGSRRLTGLPIKRPVGTAWAAWAGVSSGMMSVPII